jgi:hypothetical protein
MDVFQGVFDLIQTKMAGLFGLQEYIQSFHAWQLTLCLVSFSCLLSAIALFALVISHIRLKARLKESYGGRASSDKAALPGTM